uniref:Cap-specific mRNA (nucleoside-2'-O-)-methyltransferase n=1 Tax=Vannella robusta TaxID=1487602 RepID=A0A7S4IMR7_9EUKA|mmetsp:Transcript_5316/g.6470  ORF Transcript_5316/g.6470 Transcript_5316/m.6470 type:complete len:489 (+) Transcript_5316:324-1790(+)
MSKRNRSPSWDREEGDSPAAKRRRNRFELHSPPRSQRRSPSPQRDYRRYDRNERRYHGRRDRDYRRDDRHRRHHRDDDYNRRKRHSYPHHKRYDEDLRSEEYPHGFGEEDRQIRKENYHLRQNPRKIKKCSSLERLLLEDAPQKEYYARKNELRTTNHWGQRKLLLSEIEFLTEYGERSKTVVYAGAAPGSKNEYLANLFPDHKFIFVDPNPFHEKLIAAAEQNPNIILINAFFTDETALKYKDDHVLFISDIRTADNKVMDEEKVEDTIVADNRMQMSWHLKMEPEASMLKFRLPWGKGTTKYLSGYHGDAKIYLPVWGRQSTTETRLVAIGNATYDYDNTKYEEQCFFFNTIMRCDYYEHDVDVNQVPGLCHCYDCAAEIHILKQWARKFKDAWFSTDSEPTEEEITAHVTRMCQRLNIECATSGNRDLSIIIGHGQEWFTPKLFDPEAGVVIDVGRRTPAISTTNDYTRKERGPELNEDLFQDKD